MTRRQAFRRWWARRRYRAWISRLESLRLRFAALLAEKNHAELKAEEWRERAE